MDIIKKILPPCTFQGAKQRVSTEIVDLIFENSVVDNNTKFYDLCCGTGAISLELIARGVKPENIVMLDSSSWGRFWYKVGRGEYDTKIFNDYIEQIPEDRGQIQEYLKELSMGDATRDEEYIYPILQAGAFGGKQIWREGNEWKNTSFRSFWQPTETSSRRSPVNPMMPMPNTIKERMEILVKKGKGLTCLHYDIWKFLEYIRFRNTENCIVYIDPPYKDTTGYGFGFDWSDFLSLLFDEMLYSHIYVSEKASYSEDSFQLNFKGAKGGISGNRVGKNEEWLNLYK